MKRMKLTRMMKVSQRRSRLLLCMVQKEEEGQVIIRERNQIQVLVISFKDKWAKCWHEWNYERTTTSCEFIVRREDISVCSTKKSWIWSRMWCSSIIKWTCCYICSFYKEREMFMTLDTPEERSDGLKRKYEWWLEMMCLSSLCIPFKGLFPMLSCISI